jgi:hypothetical protein
MSHDVKSREQCAASGAALEDAALRDPHWPRPRLTAMCDLRQASS